MTKLEFISLKRGTIIRHSSKGESYVVTGHAGYFPVITRTMTPTNCTEWEVAHPSKPKQGGEA